MTNLGCHFDDRRNLLNLEPLYIKGLLNLVPNDEWLPNIRHPEALEGFFAALRNESSTGSDCQEFVIGILSSTHPRLLNLSLIS